MYPYRIIVAEDERPILDNIVRKVNSLGLPVTVVATAEDGQTACALLEQHHPDILFTDIRMPGADGLAVCQYAREHCPNTQLVIISGYDDFNYARQAIRCQVNDYLLKPINIEKLRETVTAICHTLDQGQREQNHLLISNCLSGITSPALPYEFAGASFGVYLICIGNLMRSLESDIPLRQMEQQWQELGLLQELERTCLSSCQFWLIADKYPNEHILVTTCPEEELLPVLRRILEQKLSGLRPFTICAAGTSVNFHDIWQAAQKARVLLKKALIPCRSLVMVKGSASVPAYHTFDEPLQNLLRFVKNGKIPAFIDNLSSFLTLLKASPASQDELEQLLMFLLTALEDSVGSELFDRESVSTAIRQIIFMEHDDTAMYEQIQKRLVSEVTAQGMFDSSTADVACSIKRYMDEKFYEPISLDALADTYHFSVSYISRIFRRQYGTAPLKYLLQVRIEEAKRLIVQNPDWNIGMIAQLVGYPDQHYFSRIFKSTTGFSPSEYKEQQNPQAVISASSPSETAPAPPAAPSPRQTKPPPPGSCPSR